MVRALRGPHHNLMTVGISDTVLAIATAPAGCASWQRRTGLSQSHQSQTCMLHDA